MTRSATDSALGTLAKGFEQNEKLRNESVVLAIFEGVIGGIGGVDELGKMLISDFKRVRDQKEGKKERLLLEYHKLFKAWAETYEAAVKSHATMSDLSEDDLKAILSEIAISLLDDDEDFRGAALMEVANQSDRTKINEMISTLESMRDGDPLPVTKFLSSEEDNSKILEELESI